MSMLNAVLFLLLAFICLFFVVLTICCWIEVFTDFDFVFLVVAICLTIILLLPIGYFYDKHAKEKAVAEPNTIKQELRLIEGGCQ